MTRWIPKQHTMRSVTHRAWAVSDLINHDVFWIIPNWSRQKRISLSLESISTSPFKPAQVMSRVLSTDSTVSTAEYHALSILMAPFGGKEINPTRIQKRFLGQPRISLWIISTVRYSTQECWSPEKLVRWVILDVHITGTIVAPAGSRSCVCHHQSPVFISAYFRRHSETARRTGTTFRCTWIGWCAKRNWIHLIRSQ
jgi:hypothetical protein